MAHATTVDAFVDRLDRISLVREQLSRGHAAQGLNLAVFVAPDGSVSGKERPTLAGKFAIQLSGASEGDSLSLRGALDADRDGAIDIRITDTGSEDVARLVHPTTGAQVQDLGVQAKVRLVVSRDPHAPPSQARLRAARLWALSGENINTPYKPAELDAAVLGTRLVREAIPASFHPGDGTWVLLKTISPDELYFAFDAATGSAELFPKVPDEPNDAGRALFGAL